MSKKKLEIKLNYLIFVPVTARPWILQEIYNLILEQDTT